ncbi:MAG: hypothetical protein N2691_03815 [Patescibacteria group bacterium]|nr:hypothetical protein [Patescibacteria group bacterium]
MIRFMLGMIALATILVMGAGPVGAQSAPVRVPGIASQSAESPIALATDDDLAIKKAVITRVLTRYGSPLAGTADGFIKACTEYNLNCYLLPSISGVESTFGKFLLPGTYNPFGWGSGTIPFTSWEDGYMTVGKGLRHNYINRSAVTVEQIGAIYAASETWPQKVRFFLRVFEEEEREVTLLFQQGAL